MIKWIVIGFALLIAALPSWAGEVTVSGKTFKLPDGYSLELVAGPPLVDRPIVADFDEQGRLYVADSSGSNDKVQTQLANPTHRIVRLEDVDGDGKFDKSVVYADKMMFPEGAMWLDGSLYVAAPPSIWKLTDTDDDGVADTREEWFKGKTLTGCANDLHGPYLGPDGWIYWAKGAFAEQTYARPGKKPLVTKAAHIFRCRPDGTGLEPVMTGGMDNPVEVAFSTTGDRFFTTTFLQNPGDGKRDGVIHAIYGGVWGKIHGVIENHPRTTPEMMPVLSQLGAAAPSGLMRLKTSSWNETSQETLFATCFNMRKVTRHRLHRQGAGYTSDDTDFLVGTDQDFHPTDVLEDADGSLLVVDTGGWYKLCCPTSQIEKPDVFGAIYRVRKDRVPNVADPRGLKLGWKDVDRSELETRTRMLNRPAVRQRALAELARRGDQGLLPMPTGRPSYHAGEVAWLAVRVGTKEARQRLQQIVTDPEAETHVKLIALEGLSLLRADECRPAIEAAVLSEDSQIARRAAEALGRIGDSRSIAPILARLKTASADDRWLVHALTYALLEIGDGAELMKGLADAAPSVRRAILIALDQSGDSIKATQIIADLTSTDLRSMEIATWIAGRHPEWGPELAGPLLDRVRGLKDVDLSLASMLAKLAKSEAIQTLLTEALNDRTTDPASRFTVLAAMADAGLKPVPKAWIEAIGGAVAQDDGANGASLVRTVRAWGLNTDQAAPITAQLLTASRRWEDPSTSAEALAAIPRRGATLDADLFEIALERMIDDQSVPLRLAAADALGKLSLSAAQLAELAQAIRKVGPLELARVLPAFEGSNDERLGMALIDALKQSPGRSTLRAEILNPTIVKFGPPIQLAAKILLESLDEGLEARKAKLGELMAQIEASPGDIRRGQIVFNGTKASCLTCHQMGYVGGKVGPELSSIGKIRAERDLLESIVYPSASFVRSYEPFLVATKGGTQFNGFVKDDGRDDVVLATSATEVVRIPRSEIEEMRPGSVSIMPAGLDQQLSIQDLADLVAFLKSRM